MGVRTSACLFRVTQSTITEGKNTDVPQLTKRLLPSEPIVTWKYHKSKMCLVHLTYQPSWLSLTYLKHAQSIKSRKHGSTLAGVSSLGPAGHMRLRMAMHAAQHEIINLLKTSWDFLVIMCHNVFNVWPKRTLFLPVWPRDARGLDTPWA